MNKPAHTCKGLTFIPVPEFDAVKTAFGADSSSYFKRHDLPDVPSKYTDMANRLFFSGGRMPELSPEIDKTKATAAVRAWLSSFNPSHEQKETTVGYAFWVWGAK